jgi:hypothetical protein
MSDKGKSAAIEQLRREVGFGCPVCRSPFLEWHHFDPPWEKEKHWRPEGMVAMCPICHGSADRSRSHAGSYSDDELRALKKSSRSSADVIANFPTWQDKESLLVRVGGFYTDTSAPVISINEIPQIALSKNAEGLLSLTFELRNKNDDVVVKMEDNWFTALPSYVHDMTVTPKTQEVKVWLGQADVGLEFSFKRLTMDQLDVMLGKDWARAEELAAGKLEVLLAQLLPDQRTFLETALRKANSGSLQPPPWLDELPPELREAALAKDKTGYAVKRWVSENCKVVGGLIPLLNFEQMALHFHGQRITIKDGIGDSFIYCAAFGCGKGAVNLSCDCAVCLRGPEKSADEPRPP